MTGRRQKTPGDPAKPARKPSQKKPRRRAATAASPKAIPKPAIGRPRVEIDWKEFDSLCAMQCTLAEIAAFFECSEDTIERAVKREHNIRFAEYFAQKRQKGFTSLRRAQFAGALAGNPALLIWLGKQLLAQKDKVEHADPNGAPLAGVTIEIHNGDGTAPTVEVIR